MSTFYVAKTGSDANPGTLGSPKLTIAAGLALLSGGDTLEIGNGTYNEQIINTIPGGHQREPNHDPCCQRTSGHSAADSADTELCRH